MFLLKKITLLFSLFPLSYINGITDDSRSFFISWLIYFALFLIDYIEEHTLMRQDNRNKTLIFYKISIGLIGILTFVAALGSFGIIQMSSNQEMIADSNFIIMDGLFYLFSGNSITIEAFVIFASIIVLLIIITELFVNPINSPKKKQKLRYEKRGEVA